MKVILTEELWIVIKPILQTKINKVGRPEIDIKKSLEGLLYVLENGIKWRCLPSEYGKPSTVHGKYMRWIKKGKIQKIFEIIRKIYLEATNAFENWYASDTSSCKAPYAKYSGKNPTDRAKRGVKKSILVDSLGAPLAVDSFPANQHDSKMLLSLLSDIKPVMKSLIAVVALDSAYDSKELREEAIKSGFILHASTNKRRNKNCRVIKPVGRWKVEPVHSWLNNFRSIKICYAKSKESFVGFLQIAAAILLFRMSLIFG